MRQIFFRDIKTCFFIKSYYIPKCLLKDLIYSIKINCNSFSFHELAGMKQKSILLSLLASCCWLFIRAQSNMPTDRNATSATIKLYQNLKKTINRGILFGHQDDLAYGVGWFGDSGRSSVKDIIGDYPAVYGWDLGHIEQDSPYNLDSVSFDNMRRYIQDGYARGGVITISWHLNNPVNGKSAWDTSKGIVRELLQGGSSYDLYRTWMDKVAFFINSLRDKNGELIPVIFRPYHELTGDWFWWGKNRCNEQQIKDLLRYTITYFRDKKQLHNLLYVYNTSGFKTQDAFLERYPGDDIIDILSFDDYQYGDASKDDIYTLNVDQQLTMLEEMASLKNKIPAFAETGYEKIPYATWWTNCFLKAMIKHKISYVLVWRDGGLVGGRPPRQYSPSYSHFIPTPHHNSEADFVRMYESGKFIFQKKVATFNLYK